jgi:hypothetical protein
MSAPDASWRSSQAGVLDEQTAAIAVALEHLENVEGVLEHRGRDALLTELRSFAGGLRAEQGAMTSEASELRATRPSSPLPMSLTTRYPRRRPADADPREEGHDDRRPIRAADAAAADHAD